MNGFCSEHKDNCKKIFDACQAIGKITRLESDVESIYSTIFGEGDSNSLKSRIKGTEDELKGLKELVLENREVVHTNMKGLFKIFVLTITAASAIIVIVFGVMWSELRSVNNTVANLQHHQMRQPSESPSLPSNPPFNSLNGVRP